MDKVEELVVAPFRDIAHKGKEARNNAGDHQDMAAESQKLVRNSERILSTIVPLCERLHEEYGTNFVDELKDNDEIADYRTQMIDRLWEFDDAIYPDQFKKQQYVELQKLCKDAYLSIGEILRRMKLEPVLKASPKGVQSSSPAANPNVTYNVDRRADDNRVRIPVEAPPTPEPHNEGEGEGERTASPPPPPDHDPWDIRTHPPLDSTPEPPADGDDMRRPAVSHNDSALPSPSTTPHRRMPSQDSTHRPWGSGFPGGSCGHSGREPQDRRISTVSPTQDEIPRTSIGSYDAAVSFPLWGRSRAPSATFRWAIPEDGAQSTVPDGTQAASLTGVSRARSHRDSRASLHSLHSNSSVQHSRSSVQGSIADGGSHSDRPRVVPEDPDDVTGDGYSMVRRPTFSSDFEYESGLELVRREIDPREEKILADDSSGRVPPGVAQPASRSRNCKIGVTSSFCVYKGFCEGSKAMTKGRPGFKKTKKPSFTTTHSIARCTSCDYELSHQEVDTDVGKKSEGTYVHAGVRHRIRFLQKSHIATKRSDESLYGCVFCIHESETLEECDATVFFSYKSLLEHVARHPRPLPRVPGFTVVEGAEVPPGLHNDFDLHLRKPPMPSPMDEVRDHIDNAPTASATKTVRRMYGTLRQPPDLETPAIEVAEGARLVGIEFPSRYRGEWATGYHDGLVTAIPLDYIRLDPPPVREVPMAGSSNVSARTKWRFAPRTNTRTGGGGEWLRFDKGEKITNISYAHADHWCWSGKNSRGEWGMFPQTFIDTNTTKEPTASERASERAREQKVEDRKWTIFKGRRTMRPSSIVGSSGEAAGAGRVLP